MMKKKIKINGEHLYTVKQSGNKKIFKRSKHPDWIDPCKGEEILSMIREGQATIVTNCFSGEELVLNQEQLMALVYLINTIEITET